VADESETPGATPPPAEEQSGDGPPPVAERPAERDRGSGDQSLRLDRDAADHPDDGGKVIAFRARSGAVVGSTTGSPELGTDDRDHAGPDATGAPGAAPGAFPRYGFGLDDEHDVGDTLLTTDVITDPSIAADAVDDGQPADWAWVEEWRAAREPVPWATGLALAAFSALVVAVAVWVLSAGLAGSPVLAVGVNLLVAGGLAPAMWLSRGLPVLRWIALGSAVGVLAGWVCALTMLPLPTP